jgi:hypothetical protein
VGLYETDPMFYLSANVQGIVDEKHAERIAGDIVCPVQIRGDTRVVIDALKIEV